MTSFCIQNLPDYIYTATLKFRTFSVFFFTTRNCNSICNFKLETCLKTHLNVERCYLYSSVTQIYGPCLRETRVYFF